MEFEALRTEVRSGVSHFPIFIGFLPAGEILKVASAPSFKVDTPHSQIARNVINPPIEDWQRPLDDQRVQGIKAVFADKGDFMPNPVLLSENPQAPRSVFVKRATGSAGIELSTYRITVDVPRASSQKPLWILDGQHRISGLAQSRQASNPVPFVLLVNDGPAAYDAAHFAKLFAQVTTTATALDPLHNEWLTYAFRLGEYGTTHDSQDHFDAMSAVAFLCETQTSPAQPSNNPFFNRVGFNPHSIPVGPANGGFQFQASELKAIVYREYYRKGQNAGRLTPKAVAHQISSAYQALARTVSGEPKKTVFFGAVAGGKPIQDGFLAGVLTYLRLHGVPEDWETILRERSFHKTDWDFSSWLVTTGGKAGTVTKKVAKQVFEWLFSQVNVHLDEEDLANTLQGHGAWVRFESGYLTPRGSRSRVGQLEKRIESGTVSFSVDDRHYLRLDGTPLFPSIGKIAILDRDRPLENVFSYASLRNGVDLQKLSDDAYKLLMELEFFGGVKREVQVTIKRR